MCHAVPARVVEPLPDEQAVVDLGGVRKTVSTTLVGPVEPGEYLIVHVGFALSRLDTAEAEATIDTLAAMEETP